MGKIFFQVERKLFERIISNCAKHNASPRIWTNVLNGINIKYDGEKLCFVTTNGDKLYKAEIESPDILEKTGKYKATTFDLCKLANIRFFKFKQRDLIHLLQITIDDKYGMIINDPLAEITYKIKIITSDFKFPDYEKLLPKKSKEETTQTIYFNRTYLQEILQTTFAQKTTEIVSITFDKDNALKPLVIKGKDDTIEVNSLSLLMPIEVRE